MKKLFLALLMTVAASTSQAAPGRCDLQVYFHTGAYGAPANFFASIKSTLAMKGFTNIQFAQNSNSFKRLALQFGVETPGFNMSEKAWMVLSDETKVTTDEKYIYSSQRRSYVSGALVAFQKLTTELPNCR